MNLHVILHRGHANLLCSVPILVYAAKVSKGWFFKWLIFYWHHLRRKGIFIKKAGGKQSKNK